MKRRVANGFIVEENGRFKAVFIREGVSKNGNRWPRRILDAMLKIVEGVPIHLYDASEKGNRTFFTHWASIRSKLPPALARLLPTRLPDATVGRVTEPRVTVVDNVAQLEGYVETENASLIKGLLRKANRIGQKLGLSIHIDEGDLSSFEIEEGGVELTEVRKITGFDIVSFPSAGGKFLPVLEAWSREEKGMNRLVQRLLALLTEEQRKSLTESVGDLPPDSIEKASSLVKRYPEFVEELLECLEMEVPKASQQYVLEAMAKDVPDGTPEKRKKTPPHHDAVKRLQDDPEGTSRKTIKNKPRSAPASGPAFSGGKKKKDVKEDDDEEFDGVSRHEFDNLNESVRGVLTSACRDQVRSKVANAKLPEGLQKFALEHWDSLIDAHGIIALEDVDDFIADLKSSIGKQKNANGSHLEAVEGVHVGGAISLYEEWSSGDKIMAAFEGMMNNQEHGILESNGNKIKVPSFRSIRQAYGLITGDIYCEGRTYYQRPLREKQRAGCVESLPWDKIPEFHLWRAARGGAVAEAMLSAAFPLLLSDNMHKAMLRDYNSLPFEWKLVGTPKSVTDFKNHNFHRVGEFANLPVVDEGDIYTDWDATGPSEEEITIAIQKRGGHAQLSWEMIVNDDLNEIQSWPGKIARASNRTLDDHVFGIIRDNTAFEEDAVALVAAGHANHGVGAIDLANLQAMRAQIHAQEDLDAQEHGRLVGRHVLVPPEIYDTAYELLFTDGKPTLASTDSDKRPNVLRSKYGLSLHEIAAFTDANNYWMTASASEADFIFVLFLNGQQNPQIYVQDLDRVGTFFDSDEIRWKVRHIYQAEAVDYKPIAGRIVP